MAKTEICFSFAFRGDSHVAMEVNRHGVADINICVPTEEIIKLFNDCLSEWDILFPQEREDIKDIYQYIGKILKDGDLSVVDIMSAERKVIMPVKNMFGFNYYTRVVSLMDMGGEAIQPSEDNPFGNPMMFALLSNEGGFDKLDPMMMFALMGGMGGNMKDMNPMMLAMMLSK